ncbi:hypothetical protein LENED_011628 [Lentinula edodes]|uniref:Uncharacterized protein n=1 Tax=Lentinula edodes TaxID=5353 RepID=A0A1Q3EQK0_LENED|nr:hypothetical protein LENED_011628 [Lentinula edodes]
MEQTKNACMRSFDKQTLRKYEKSVSPALIELQDKAKADALNDVAASNILPSKRRRRRFDFGEVVDRFWAFLGGIALSTFLHGNFYYSLKTRSSSSNNVSPFRQISTKLRAPTKSSYNVWHLVILNPITVTSQLQYSHMSGIDYFLLSIRLRPTSNFKTAPQPFSFEGSLGRRHQSYHETFISCLLRIIILSWPESESNLIKLGPQ